MEHFLVGSAPIGFGKLTQKKIFVCVTPLSQLRFNPKGAPRKDLGDVLKPLLDPNLDA